MARLSLLQQIAQLDDTLPLDIDPEDIRDPLLESDDEHQNDLAAAREHYVEVGASALRKEVDALNDPKYVGVRATRKQLLEDAGDKWSDRDGSNSQSDSEQEERPQEQSAVERDSEPEGSASEEEESEREGRSSPPGQKSQDVRAAEDMTTTLHQTRQSDRMKGKAVSRQIGIWDGLLDARIGLQKSVVASNKLPSLDQSGLYQESTDCQAALTRMLEQSRLLSEELFELQEKLIVSNEALSLPARKRRKVSIGSDSDMQSYFQEATQDAVTLEHTYHPLLIDTLTKWSAKIQAVAPSVLLPSNRNAFSKSNQHLKSAVQLVDEQLVEHKKLLTRTQTRKTQGSRIGTEPQGDKSEELIDEELFDDTDFYQQLLRDVIESRGGETGGPGDWIAAQKQKKAKKKVDTRASKGRKLRYEVHEKLQNFMMPVMAAGAWHEEQIDELFMSLLGRGFENIGVEGDRGIGQIEERIEGALQDGFRVFG